MEASFFQRAGAYLIDIIIISIILSIVMVGFTNPKLDKINEKNEELMNSFTAAEITEEDYIEEYSSLLYEYNKANIIGNAVNLILYIGYFVVFQFLNNGQTLGKKLLKIKVEGNKDKINIVNYIFRGIFIYSIFSLLYNTTIINILNNNNYMLGYSIITAFESIFVIISMLFVLYRKDKRGLHDMMANTKVVSEVK